MLEGRFQWYGGSSYNGQFKSNLPNGEGTYDWGKGDGRKYFGKFRDGKFHGEGKYISRKRFTEEKNKGNDVKNIDKSTLDDVYYIDGVKKKDKAEYDKEMNNNNED